MVLQALFLLTHVAPDLATMPSPQTAHADPASFRTRSAALPALHNRHTTDPRGRGSQSTQASRTQGRRTIYVEGADNLGELR
jgi:hypothetical protein